MKLLLNFAYSLIAGAVIVAVVALPVSCAKQTNDKIESAIQNGADPIEANCAFAAVPDRVTCAVAATKAK